MSPIRIAIAGATGRMGRALIRLAAADEGLQLAAAITETGDTLLGRDAGEIAMGEAIDVPITDEPPDDCDVLVEFTALAGFRRWLSWAGEAGVPLVSGTTGLTGEDRDALASAAERIAVLWAPNMSIGVTLLLKLVREVAATLGEDWDAEIVETHHRHKVDAPSGTANALLAALANGRGQSASDHARFGRHGQVGQRPRGEIGVHAVRLGGVVGDHDVHFATEDEAITLTHHARSRDIFARGALRAAKWLAAQQPGVYTMQDVLAS